MTMALAAKMTVQQKDIYLQPSSPLGTLLTNFSIMRSVHAALLAIGSTLLAG